MNLQILAALPLLTPLAPSQDEFVPGTHVPPEIGAVAKPLETVYWYDYGREDDITPIFARRGQVVLVHTWGYYCGPCMSKGVPYVVDLMKAHRDGGLRAYSISVQIGDGKPDDHFVTVGREMGIEHPMGLADGYGGMSPYLNMDVSKGLTWCFVIGREGGVHWAGDPSIDEEEFLAAVANALLEEAKPALEAQIPEPLDKAVGYYVEGELARAGTEAAKVRVKFEKKQGDEEALAVVASATELIAQIEAHREELVLRLDAALANRDAQEYVTARRLLLARYAKTDAAKGVKGLDAQAKSDEAFQDELELWGEWVDLRRSAPALFPVRVDRDTERYAQQLEKFVDGAEAGAPGLPEARQMLAIFRGE